MVTRASGPANRTSSASIKSLERIPDARVRLQELVEQGESAAIRYVITGTQDQTFLGIPAIGQTIHLPGISMLHFRDGKCAERWVCSDSMVLLSQLRGASRT